MTHVTGGADDAALIRFWALALQLKRLRRQGWLDRGVSEPESGADHSWGVALLAWLLAAGRPDLDRGRVLLLGLVHDLPEALAGDATPFDAARDAQGAIPPEHFSDPPSYTDEARQAKQAAEQEALDRMLAGLPAEIAGDVRTAWHEYERGNSPEARFVRQVDKVETLLQAEQYQADQPDLVVESFRLGAQRDVTDPALARLLAALSRPEPPEPPE